jgi:hypothetical protein
MACKNLQKPHIQASMAGIDFGGCLIKLSGEKE